ncbi:MAG: helix-turn-helix domain-containing protein [Ktedonobacteraceae bacterium]
MQSSNYVSVGNVADAYGKSVETVRRWCRIGAIEGARRVGRDWIIPSRYTSGAEEIILPDNQREGVEAHKI